jgi:hypothetical protein
MKFAVSFALELLLSLANSIPVNEAGKPFNKEVNPHLWPEDLAVSDSSYR